MPCQAALRPRLRVGASRRPQGGLKGLTRLATPLTSRGHPGPARAWATPARESRMNYESDPAAPCAAPRHPTPGPADRRARRAGLCAALTAAATFPPNSFLSSGRALPSSAQPCRARGSQSATWAKPDGKAPLAYPESKTIVKNIHFNNLPPRGGEAAWPPAGPATLPGAAGPGRALPGRGTVNIGRSPSLLFPSGHTAFPAERRFPPRRGW